MFTNLDTDKQEKKLRFRVSGVNVAVMNALRRCIITHVPTAAFHYDATLSTLPDAGIVFHRNTSVIHNEMLGGRISLVPICATESILKEMMDKPDAYAFEIKVKNTSPHVLLVTSKDIVVRVGGNTDEEMRDVMFPPCPLTGDHILLTKLKPNHYNNTNGEEVHAECRVTVKAECDGHRDTRKHARWSPVSACFFTNTVDDVAARKAFLASEQKEVDKSVASVEARTHAFDTIGRQRHFYPNVFDFSLESECGLRAPFLVLYGFKAMVGRVSGVLHALETRDSGKITFVSLDTTRGRTVPLVKQVDKEDGDGQQDMYNICITDEDHTCGNLVQALLYERNFGKGDDIPREGRDISYVGYHQPHPLEREIVLRVKLANPSADVEDVLITQISWIVARLKTHVEEWKRASGMATPSGRTKYALEAHGM